MHIMQKLFLLQNEEVVKQRKQLVSVIIQSHGSQLVSNLIEASIFSLHSYMLSGVAEVIMELLENDRNVSTLVGCLRKLNLIIMTCLFL